MALTSDNPPAATGGPAPVAPLPAGGYRPALLPSLLYALGMAAVFLSERVIDVGSARTVVLVVGLALLLAAVGVRALRLGSVHPAYRYPERVLLLLYLVGMGGLALYFLNSDLLAGVLGKPLSQSAPRLSTALGALWPALWIGASLPVLFIEMALLNMAKAPVLELGRVRTALLSGLGIASALVFCFALSYVAAERDVRADFSYFRTAKPSDSTRKIVQALDKPVAVHLFFPPANEVRDEVEGYFGELGRASKLLEVQRWDQALHPAKARELGVSSNGTVVIVRDALKEQLPLPVDIERARAQLKNLDQEVQKRLLGVTRKQKIAYFTVGHEERSNETTGDADRRATIRQMRAVLTDQNFESKDLGLAQGLASEIPADASLVLIVGPRRPFQAGELAALQRYLDKNGRLLIALDPDGGQAMPELLAPLSLKYTPVTLADDRVYMPLNHAKSDRANIGTGTFSSHVSVTTLSRYGRRAPVLMLGAGSLAKQEKTAAGIVNNDFIIRSESSTWNDVNGDFELTTGSEVRTVYELAAAVTKRNASAIAPEDEARVVVLADSDALADLALSRHQPNLMMFVDMLRWLGGEERFAGAVSNEEDVPVAHTRKQDLLWFYLSIFAAPAAVLGLGFVMTRRRRGARQRVAAQPPSSGAAPGGGTESGSKSGTTSAEVSS
jgi:hypothetical protein